MKTTNEYWEKRLSSDTNEKVANAIKKVYAAYPEECLPQGICDSMYIINIIAAEIGFGDGQSNFWPDADINIEAIAETYINGNISDAKEAIKKMSKSQFIDFAEHMRGYYNKSLNELRNLV